MSIGALHHAAGLFIAADAPIPGLPVITTSSPPDLYIHLESPAPWHHLPFEDFYRADYVTADQQPMVTVGRAAGGVRFQYADGTRVWIDRSGTRAWCRSAAGATLEDTAVYLTGPILGFILRQRGHVALHASAVKIGDGALAIVGPHGAGKSTTAAALAMRGFPLISDDVLHVRKTASVWLAEPYANGLRLWPEAVSLVLGPDVSLPRLTPTWDKRVLRVDAFDVTAAVEPVAVRAILFIEEAESAADASRFVPLGPAEAVVRLATHSSASHLLDDSARAREFHALADLVGSIRSVQLMARGCQGSFAACMDRVQHWAAEAAGAYRQLTHEETTSALCRAHSSSSSVRQNRQPTRPNNGSR